MDLPKDDLTRKLTEAISRADRLASTNVAISKNDVHSKDANDSETQKVDSSVLNKYVIVEFISASKRYDQIQKDNLNSRLLSFVIVMFVISLLLLPIILYLESEVEISWVIVDLFPTKSFDPKM